MKLIPITSDQSPMPVFIVCYSFVHCFNNTVEDKLSITASISTFKCSDNEKQMVWTMYRTGKSPLIMQVIHYLGERERERRGE